MFQKTFEDENHNKLDDKVNEWVNWGYKINSPLVDSGAEFIEDEIDDLEIKIIEIKKEYSEFRDMHYSTIIYKKK